MTFMNREEIKIMEEKMKADPKLEKELRFMVDCMKECVDEKGESE